MCIEDYTKVYLLKKYEDEKNVVLTCPLCVLELEYEKAKETLFFAFREDIIDADEFKCLYVELKNLYFSRKCSKCAETKEEEVKAIKAAVKLDVLSSMAEYIEKEFIRVKENDIPHTDYEEANVTFYYGYFRAAYELGAISEDRCDEMCDEITKLFRQKENK